MDSVETGARLMNPLRLANAVTSPSSTVRCQFCDDWGDPGLMFPVKYITKDNGVSTRYAHLRCRE